MAAAGAGSPQLDLGPLAPHPLPPVSALVPSLTCFHVKGRETYLPTWLIFHMVTMAKARLH